MTSNNNISPGTKQPGNIVASMPRDQFRSVFYLLSGKPDSRIKVFDGALHLRPRDIVELKECVQRKLQTHNIDATTTTVKVSYVGSEMSEFGTWQEFENHHWQEPEKIEELVIKWDFLVNIISYEVPQRHTLLFRVSSDIKPGKLMQLLSSGNSDDFDSEEMFSSPAFCRVDFINAQLSKELINVVHDWHRGRESPVLIPSAYYWFKNRRQGLTEFLDHWLVLSWALLVAALMIYGASRWFAGDVPTHIAAVACFLAIYSLGPARRLASGMASRVFRALSEIEGSRVVFEFTSGDRKRISEIQRENSKQGRRFIVNAVWNVFLNLLAAVIYAYLFVSVENASPVPKALLADTSWETQTQAGTSICRKAQSIAI